MSNISVIVRQVQIILHEEGTPICFLNAFINGDKAILYSLNGKHLHKFIPHLPKIFLDLGVEEMEAVMQARVVRLIERLLPEGTVMSIGKGIEYDNLDMNVITFRRVK